MTGFEKESNEKLFLLKMAYETGAIPDCSEENNTRNVLSRILEEEESRRNRKKPKEE